MVTATILQFRIIRQDQEVRWIKATCKKRFDKNGQLIILMGVLNDITETQLRAEMMEKMIAERTQDLESARSEAEEANKAKSLFLSRMSHELRTPMNSVLGFAKLLEMSLLTDKQKRNIQRITKAGEHLLDLINEILEISRIESGSNKIKLEPIRFQPVLKESLDIISPMIVNKGIILKFPGLAYKRCVIADRKALEQFILNLLSNAVKYNKEGGTIEILFDQHKGQRLKVGFKDTGNGILEEQREKLFQPFERLNAAELGIDGTGLGLCLSRSLMESMGGTLTFESELGNGSIFWIELNKGVCTGDVPVGESNKLESAFSETIHSDGETVVLYIDDNNDNLVLVKELLSDVEKCKLITTQQGASAFEMVVEF